MGKKEVLWSLEHSFCICDPASRALLVLAGMTEGADPVYTLSASHPHLGESVFFMLNVSICAPQPLPVDSLL